MNVWLYLKQPFPKAETRKWRTVVLISLFVTLFLVLFQPFGIGQIESSRKLIFISGFGLVSFIVLTFDLIIIERLFVNFFREQNWYLYKEIIWLLYVVLSIGLGNVLYVTLFSDQNLTLNNIINFQIVTSAVAIFPITIFAISKQNYLLNRYRTSANIVNDNLVRESTISQEEGLSRTVSLLSYNEKVKEEFDVDAFCYIESKGNNLELYLYENSQLSRVTVRNTLKRSLEYLVDYPELIQCHRSYIVNLSRVKSVEGNSQGLLLKLEDCDIDVPVSRTFITAVKSKLN